jgi:hypothetical protein
MNITFIINDIGIMFSMTNTPDAQQMHKIANENVAVTKDRLKPPLM